MNDDPRYVNLACAKMLKALGFPQDDSSHLWLKTTLGSLWYLSTALPRLSDTTIAAPVLLSGSQEHPGALDWLDTQKVQWWKIDRLGTWNAGRFSWDDERGNSWNLLDYQSPHLLLETVLNRLCAERNITVKDGAQP